MRMRGLNSLALVVLVLTGGAAWSAPPGTRAGPDWWSFQPIKKPSAPELANDPWARNPIDAFVLAELRARQLRPAPEAERRVWLRRVTIDLTGLLPTPDELDRFLNDAAPGAYEKVVDRLLASPRYGERWGRHWLDVVRFAESSGYESNRPRLNAYHYRDWVIRSINEDKPFPNFVQEQLAGDAVANGDALVDAATGFLVAGTTDLNVSQNLEARLVQRLNDLDDMITAVGSAFLGLTVNCARCHDHKFDPVSQREYYGLQAVLNGVYPGERPVRDADFEKRWAEAEKVRAALSALYAARDRLEPLAGKRGAKPARPATTIDRNVERIAPVKARFVRMVIGGALKDAGPAIDEFEVFSAAPLPRNLALASNGGKETASPEAGEKFAIRKLNDGLFGDNSCWVSGAPGQGWVMIEFPQEAVIDRVVWSRDRTGKLRNRLPTDYVIEVSTDGKQWREIAGSWDRLPSGTAGPKAETPEQKAWREQVQPLEERLAALSQGPTTFAGTFRLAGPAFVLKGGEPKRPAEEAPPAVIGVLGGTFAADAGTPEQKRRLALAAWIADDRNPLPDRVMVNRLWHYHFGQGLVRTPSDFGFNGDRPSHPELLDWLASEYRAAGKRLKPIHRLIVLSSAYRQSSRSDPKALAVDADDRLLWRYPPRRLEAEVIRDAMLQVSGSLNQEMGGPGYSIFEFIPKANVQYPFKEKLGPETFRRMVYQFSPRIYQDATFGAFDCPDSNLSTPRRTVSTTALQALNLWNSAFVLDQCERWAKRLDKEAGSEPAAQVRRAFSLIFGRTPTDDEQGTAVQLVQSHGLAALCRSLFNSNEFLYGP
jgi:hypothetical protein